MSGIPTNIVSANGVAVITDAQLNTFTQTDATVSDLRGFVGITNLTTVLLGLDAPGQGGGGLFFWNNGSFTDDGVNTIVPPAAAGQGAWLRVPLANPEAVIPAGNTSYLLGATGTENVAGLVTVGPGLTISGETLSAVAVPQPYDIAGYFSAAPAVGYALQRTVMVRQVVFPDNFTGSQAVCETAPTYAVTLPILQNSGTIGALSFAASSTAGTFSTTGAVTLNVGDVLEIDPPSPADPTFATISWTFAGETT